MVYFLTQRQHQATSFFNRLVSKPSLTPPEQKKTEHWTQRFRVTTSCRLKLSRLNARNEFKGTNKGPDQVALVQNHDKGFTNIFTQSQSSNHSYIMKQFKVADRIKRTSVVINCFWYFSLLSFCLSPWQCVTVTKTQYSVTHHSRNWTHFILISQLRVTYQWHVAALQVRLHLPPALLPLSVHLCSSVVPDDGASQFVHLHPSMRTPLSTQSGMAASVGGSLLWAGRRPKQSQHW